MTKIWYGTRGRDTIRHVLSTKIPQPQRKTEWSNAFAVLSLSEWGPWRLRRGKRIKRFRVVGVWTMAIAYHNPLELFPPCLPYNSYWRFKRMRLRDVIRVLVKYHCQGVMIGLLFQCWRREDVESSSQSEQKCEKEKRKASAFWKWRWETEENQYRQWNRCVNKCIFMKMFCVFIRLLYSINKLWFLRNYYGFSKWRMRQSHQLIFHDFLDVL